MNLVYLGIGSNIGDRQKNIDNAILELGKNSIIVCQVSSIIETDPVGGPPQDKYLNACLKIETDRDPYDLLFCLKEIEREMGRIDSPQNSPRIIDLDILIYNDIKIDTETLTIPHPRMMVRDFVLKPLQEINPVFTKNI